MEKTIEKEMTIHEFNTRKELAILQARKMQSMGIDCYVYKVNYSFFVTTEREMFRNGHERLRVASFEAEYTYFEGDNSAKAG